MSYGKTLFTDNAKAHLRGRTIVRVSETSIHLDDGTSLTIDSDDRRVINERTEDETPANATAVVVQEATESNIKELLENLPEASRGNVLVCHGWDYEQCEFDFADNETGLHHTLTMTLAKAGLVKMFDDIQSGTLKRTDIPFPNNDDALCNWDAESIDILVQYSFFGKLIYG